MINNISISNASVDSDKPNMLAKFIHQCLNISTDKLHNPNDLLQLLVYASIAFSIIIPAACFALFVYPMVEAYTENKTHAASITLLEQQVTQLKRMHQDNHSALIDMETDDLLILLHNTTEAQHNPIELHRLAYDYGLKIIAIDTLNYQEVQAEFIEYFTTTRFLWHLRGYFSDYLAFKKTLWEQQPLIQLEREHLSPQENRQLDIVVELNVHQPKDIAL